MLIYGQISLQIPASLITETLKVNIVKYTGKYKKLANQIQLQKINILGTFELDFSKSGLPDNITLFHVINHLIQLTQKPVLLIIDEAQHALTTQDGINTMFAIKSARDQN